MPTKPIDRKIKKSKKEKVIVEKPATGKRRDQTVEFRDNLNVLLVSGPSQPKVKPVQVKPVQVKPSKLTSKKEMPLKKKKSFPRRVLSWSIAAYLGYYVFAGCGSPDDQDSQKPAICESVDRLKLDTYALFDNTIYPYAYPIYKSKIHPYVSPAVTQAKTYYEHYGMPAQTRLIEYYDQHGKPMVDQASIRAREVYHKQVVPVVYPYMNQASMTAREVYHKQVVPVVYPYMYQAKTMAEPHLQKIQFLAQQQWDHAPPHVKRAFYTTVKAVQEWYRQAETTDLVPILIEFYYKTIEFFQYQLWPAIQSSPLSHHIQSNYNQHVKAYVDLRLKPVWTKYNDHVHLDQLLAHLWAALPQRPKYTSSYTSPLLKDQTVGSSIGQIKTPVSVESVSEAPTVPITTTKAVSKSSEEALSATPAPAVEQPILLNQHEREPSQAKESTATSSTKQQAESTIDHTQMLNKNDVVKDKSTSPDATHHDQIIVSPTEKDVAPIPEKQQEVAEKKTVPPPQSPTHFDARQDQVVIQVESDNNQVSSSAEQASMKEKIVKPIQEKVIEPVQHKVEEIKEKLHLKKEEEKVVKVIEQKEPGQDKVEQAKEEKTVEPEVAKPIEFDMKPVEKIMEMTHDSTEQPKEKAETPEEQKKAAPVVQTERNAVRDQAPFTTEEQVSKDIPPVVIEDVEIVADEEIVLDNKPIVSNDESQFIVN
ncbi:hypothetical protein BD560DRAFT_450918 [Blakeslea trispora]|nr:hypothetical protein BD560DRAFT_450918 [Blakeslea trispora]